MAGGDDSAGLAGRDYSVNQVGRTALYFFLGIFQLSLGLGLLTIMMASEVTTGTESSASNSESTVCPGAGYDKGEFTALLFSQMLLPSGAIFLLAGMLGVFRNPDHSRFAKVAVFMILAPVFLILAVLAWVEWGYEILDCGIVGCVDMDDETTDNTDYYGFTPICGTIGFILALTYLVFDLVLLALSFRPEDDELSSDHEKMVYAAVPTVHVPDLVDQQRSKSCANAVSMLLTWVVFMPLLIFLVMLLPNCWTYFTGYYIEAEAETGVSSAEYDATLFFSATINYGDWYSGSSSSSGGGYRTLKIYPDVAMFYIFLYSLLLLGIISQNVPAVKRCMNLRMPCWHLTLGVVVIFHMFALLMTFWIYYWAVEHDWAWQYGDWTNAENWARTFGQVGNLLMGLLILPVSRNSIWPTTLGFSWERMIETHIWLSYAYLGSVLVHMFCWWVVYAQQGYFPHDVLAVPMYYPSNDYNYDDPCADDFTVPLATVTFWISLIVFGILTLPPIRRKFFEVFYYSHHFFLVLWSVQLWHAASCWYFILGGLTFWFADRCMRFVKGARGMVTTIPQVFVHRMNDRQQTEIVEIYIPNKPDVVNTHTAGQFVFLNLPCIDMLEWHPFTISSSPCDNFRSFHIKNMSPGSGQWTDRLCEYAKKNSEDTDDFNVIIDGSYGLPITPAEHEAVVLFAGGIGITPCIAMFRQWFAERRAGMVTADVHLVWVAKTSASFDMFKSTFDAVAEAKDARFSFHLFATETGRAGNDSKDMMTSYPDLEKSTIPHDYGRPVMATLVQDMMLPTDLGKTVFHVCGPEPLTEVVSELAYDLGAQYSHETFEL